MCNLDLETGTHWRLYLGGDGEKEARGWNADRAQPIKDSPVKRVGVIQVREAPG